MKIEHIAIWTNQLEQLKDFYVKYFNGNVGEKYYNPIKQFESYFISFNEGARLEIMKKPNLINVNTESQIIGYAHLAFSVGSEEEVDRLTEILRDDGYIIVGEPRVTGDGYYESCILDPDGNTIEITI